MTKEEAINHIRYGIIEGNYPLPKELGIEACEMAIKALEQQPCDDCISRQAAIDALRDAENYAFNSYYKGLIKAHKIIANLPPVIPQPKIGRWYSTGIQGEIDGQIVKEFVCSECSAISVFRMAEGRIVNGDLCPNCRAKMEEVKK